ncbi:MAG TPA: hypothetical protein VG096_19735 [Bryobacteraceae bacterium]|jgi:hypothetical protein|nr:hypothetical protein [Bryobacteraceae bacterium]
MRPILVLALLASAAGAMGAALDEARAEPNLEKRSNLALANAVAALKSARDAYRAGDTQMAMTKIAEVQESVELGYASLVKTGKDPRKNPKWFKRAEIETRDLLRSMESFEHEMSFSDRPMLEKVKERVQQIHDDLLTGLMEGKHK